MYEIIFFALFSQSDDKIYVVVDNNPQSVMLKAELTRDWTKGRKLNSECYALANKQLELQPNLILIDRFNPDERTLHSVPDVSTYPSYRVGKYKRFQTVPAEAFETSSYPLLTVVALRHNFLAISTTEWRDKCNELKDVAQYNYINAVVLWSIANKIDEVKDISEYGYGEEFGSGVPLKEIETKHRERADFPRFVAPEFPAFPLIRFPFQSEEDFQKLKLKEFKQ